jgi:hypothetical protein
VFRIAGSPSHEDRLPVNPEHQAHQPVKAAQVLITANQLKRWPRCHLHSGSVLSDPPESSLTFDKKRKPLRSLVSVKRGTMRPEWSRNA